MNTPLKYIFSICVLFATNFATAQKNIENTDSLAGRFISDLRAGTTEKIFAQTNKNIFAAGEEPDTAGGQQRFHALQNPGLFFQCALHERKIRQAWRPPADFRVVVHDARGAATDARGGGRRRNHSQRRSLIFRIATFDG